MVGWWWAGQQHKNVKEIVCLLKIVQISSSYLDFFTIVEVFFSFSSINVMENQCSLKCEKNQNKYASFWKIGKRKRDETESAEEPLTSITFKMNQSMSWKYHVQKEL